MSKSVFGMTSEIVNGIWKISGEVVDAVTEEYENFIAEEAARRMQEGSSDPSSKYAYLSSEEIKQQVRKEVKSFAVRGGLIAFGLGALF